MGKGMILSLCTSYVCLYSIVPRFGQLFTWICVHEYVMNMSYMLLCEVCGMMKYNYA